MGHNYFTCHACGAQLGSRRVLEQHNRRHHPDTAQKNPGTSPKDQRISDM